MTTYSFIDTQATLVGPGGSVQLGYGAAVAEEGITISMTDDKNVVMVGADGEGMNTLRASKQGTITVRLLKTSPINSQLMALYDGQSLSSALWGQNVITVTQVGVGDQHLARSCAFKKKPDMNYKKDGDMVEWVFDSIKIDSLLGTYTQ